MRPRRRSRRRARRRQALRARRGPLEPAGKEMRRCDRVLGRRAGCLLREVGREALVEQLDGDGDDVTKRLGEALRLGGLLSALAAQGEREADDDPLGVLVGDEARDLGKARFAPGLLDDREWPRQRPRRIGDGDAGARGAVVECHHLHASAAFAAANASGIAPASSPPACAIVGRPPPLPPTIWPMSFAIFAASPRPSARLTTMWMRPSVTDATIAPSAFSCCRIRSERSRNGPGCNPFASARTTFPALSTIAKSAAASAFGFSLRAFASSPRSASASRARSWSSANASPAVTASIRRAPAPTELSERIANGPISAVERTCVPPQSSFD